MLLTGVECGVWGGTVAPAGVHDICYTSHPSHHLLNNQWRQDGGETIFPPPMAISVLFDD